MYETFYGLKQNPFQISTDPAFLWMGEKHQEAVSMLEYGIKRDGHTGILLLTGDVGAGKTTLINHLFNSLGSEIIRTSLSNPSMEPLDFFNHLAASFGRKKKFESKNEFLGKFKAFLNYTHQKKKKILLVIDEAQLIGDELLQEVRLLSNIENNQGHSLLTTFIVGQPEVRDNLATPQNRALNQRITLNYHIESLTADETGLYIQHRLKIAGTTDDIFSQEAVNLVHKHSKGLPRQINVICDNAMLSAYVRNSQEVDGDIVWGSINDVRVTRGGMSGITPDSTEPFWDDRYNASEKDVGDSEEVEVPTEKKTWRRFKKGIYILVALSVLITIAIVTGVLFLA